jgi:hypothetical protein
MFILGNNSSEDIIDLNEDLMANFFGGKCDATLSYALHHVTLTMEVVTAI